MEWLTPQVVIQALGAGLLLVLTFIYKRDQKEQKHYNRKAERHREEQAKTLSGVSSTVSIVQTKMEEGTRTMDRHSKTIKQNSDTLVAHGEQLATLKARDRD